MTEDTLLLFDLPAVSRKKVTADFEGGSISSDGGLVLLRAAERRLGLAEALAGCIREWRDPERVVHTLPAMLRFRMFAIACGYEDADDCDALRGDPLFKLAVGRAPESGRDLCSQPTMSRLENAPSRSEVARMTAALVDLFCRSFPSPPAAITLDIDDTCDAVHARLEATARGFDARYIVTSLGGDAGHLYEDKDDGRAVTHLVLIEAKAYLPWTNKQLASKAKRLKEIFGDDGKAHDAVKSHFVMMTGRLSGKIDTDSWPDWMSNGDNPRWLQYSLPTRTKVTRCTDRGRHFKNGSHLRLDEGAAPADRAGLAGTGDARAFRVRPRPHRPHHQGDAPKADDARR